MPRRLLLLLTVLAVTFVTAGPWSLGSGTGCGTSGNREAGCCCAPEADGGCSPGGTCAMGCAVEPERDQDGLPQWNAGCGCGKHSLTQLARIAAQTIERPVPLAAPRLKGPALERPHARIPNEARDVAHPPPRVEAL